MAFVYKKQLVSIEEEISAKMPGKKAENTRKSFLFAKEGRISHMTYHNFESISCHYSHHEKFALKRGSHGKKKYSPVYLYFAA